MLFDAILKSDQQIKAICLSATLNMIYASLHVTMHFINILYSLAYVAGVNMFAPLILLCNIF